MLAFIVTPTRNGKEGKSDQDQLYSGSFCLAGMAYYRAEQIGIASLAGQFTSKVRAFRRTSTPLQQQITFQPTRNPLEETVLEAPDPVPDPNQKSNLAR